MASPPNTPITVALVDDYDVVLMGVANMFDRYRDRVVVAEIDSNMGLDDAVDIVLYDSFAQPESDHDEIAVLVANPRARRVVVYTWNFHPDLIESAQQHGAARLPVEDAARAGTGRRAGGGPRRRDGHQRRPAAGPQRGRPRLAGPRRGAQRPGIGDPGAHHPGQEQRRGRDADLPQSEHRQVLHPHDLPQDRRGQPHPGRAVGRQARLHPRPPPHRALEGRALS